MLAATLRPVYKSVIVQEFYLGLDCQPMPYPRGRASFDIANAFQSLLYQPIGGDSTAVTGLADE